MGDLRRAARICWAIDRNDWAISIANLIAAVAFVAGCVVFYSPAWYIPGVTLFLVGSLVMLVAGVADVFRRHGPSC